MTFIVIILCTTFFAAVWLAADLLSPGLGFLRRSRRADAEGGPESNVDSYAPVARLLAEADFEYLSREEDLVSRLREARTSAMRLYLKRIRHDYLEVWRICRLLAPISPDPAFASQLSTQYWSFHWAYLRIQVECLVPALAARSDAAERLVHTLTEIHTQARGLLTISEASMSASPAAA